MKVNYDNLLDFEKIEEVYRTIKSNTKHKEKIFKYDVFYASNTYNVLDILQRKKFAHGKYNIFLINYPKCRVIMSENMNDKIINHVVSRYALFPLIEPLLIHQNVATRVNKGAKLGLSYVKKYINKLKMKYDKIYVLKCDIHKYFYSIDHEILLQKLDKIILDKEVFALVKSIVLSTNSEYINAELDGKIDRQKEHVSALEITRKEKEAKCLELDKLPRYNKGKGLPIGNMTSQIMAIFYLNDLDHYIKERLHIKYYIRYMDDLIIFHHDKEYLKVVLKEIENFLKDLKLTLNNKTQIYELHHGFTFLGYKFILRDKKLYTLLKNSTKKRIMNRLKLYDDKEKRKELLANYNGYLIHAQCRNFLLRLIK